MKKMIKPLASLKLAVLVLASLATLIAIGTFVEADYNAEIAAKLVYKTPWMFAIMGALAVNLAAVMVDRWPWKRRHVPFLLAHIGILMLLLGAGLTMVKGIDGSMSFGIGQKNRSVQVQDTELTVWASFDGDKYTRFYQQEVDFYKNPPTAGGKKYNIPLGEGSIEVTEYWPFALPSRKVEASNSPAAGSALRFQIQNSKVNVNEWMVQSKRGEMASHNFGPAQFHLGKAPEKSDGKNEVYLEPETEFLNYTVLYKDPARKPLRGKVKEGEVIRTGWMDLEMRVLRYLPKAEEKWHFEKIDRPTAMTTPAIKVAFQGQEHWIQLDDVLKLFTDKAVYIVSFAHRRIDIGFDLLLKEFQMGTYPGTNRPSSYQSLVALEDGHEQVISMNEPLKSHGLTFYQASFSSDADGKPNASVLSVNFDPGRWLKYLGSLIMSLGIVWLFYDKRKAAAAAAMRYKQ
jgi:hypothetical protein